MSFAGALSRMRPEGLTRCELQVDAEQWRVEKAAELVVLPERMAVPLPCPDLPELILAAVAAVQARIRRRAQTQNSLGVPVLVVKYASLGLPMPQMS